MHFDIKDISEYGLSSQEQLKRESPRKNISIETVIMEARSGFDDDGTMEDAMAEQDELESRVSVAACLSALKALFALF